MATPPLEGAPVSSARASKTLSVESTAWLDEVTMAAQRRLRERFLAIEIEAAAFRADPEFWAWLAAEEAHHGGDPVTWGAFFERGRAVTDQLRSTATPAAKGKRYRAIQRVVGAALAEPTGFLFAAAALRGYASAGGSL